MCLKIALSKPPPQKNHTHTNSDIFSAFFHKSPEFTDYFIFALQEQIRDEPLAQISDSLFTHMLSSC